MRPALLPSRRTVMRMLAGAVSLAAAGCAGPSGHDVPTGPTAAAPAPSADPVAEVSHALEARLDLLLATSHAAPVQ